jgi:hypothetical protein
LPFTGSWDGLVSLSYVLRIQKVGLIFNSSIKLNCANKNKYQYGNTTNVTANVFYMFSFKKATFVPFFFVLIMKKQIMIETRRYTLIEEVILGIVILGLN